MEQIVDIYSNMEIPMWAVLFVSTTGLPFINGLIVKAEASANTHKSVTVVLSLIAAVLGLVVAGDFSIANLLLLAAPGVFISSNSYDKFWKIFRINDWLAPNSGLGAA